jgi:hypothetical protein
MKYSLYLLPAFLVLFLFNCQPNVVENEKKLSTEEKFILDSLSKVEQKRKADSLKKINPLLILPPDSNYTGDYTDKYPSGITKFKGFFRFGELHGQWMSFYPNGLMWSELHYDKGLRHGLNTTYFEDGSIRYTGFYKNDMKDSIWIFYDTLGKVAEKVLYEKNHIVKKLPIK